MTSNRAARATRAKSTQIPRKGSCEADQPQLRRSIKFISWNVDKSILSSHERCPGGKLNYVRDICKHERPDFVLLQEVGVNSRYGGDEPPRMLAKSFSSYATYACGATSPDLGYSMSGVAVMVDPAWTVTKVVRHHSGRAIAVEVCQGDWRMVVVNVYMPSGLDEAGLESTTRRLAESLYLFAAESINGFQFFMVGGDLNETRDPTLDRRRTEAGQPQASKVPSTRARKTRAVDAFLQAPSAKTCFGLCTQKPETTRATAGGRPSTSRPAGWTIFSVPKSTFPLWSGTWRCLRSPPTRTTV